MAVVVLSIISLTSAAAAATISGIIAFHIMRNSDVACQPRIQTGFNTTEIVPYEESKTDCKQHHYNIASAMKLFEIKNKMIYF